MQVELYVYGKDISMDTFKDNNFRWYVKNKLGLDRDNDGIATSQELLAVKNIDISYTTFPHFINSLEGIGYFLNLETLNARRQPYTTLDLSKNVKLKEVDLSQSALESLDVSNNINLEKLNAQYTGLSYVNLENNTKLTTISLEQGWYQKELQKPKFSNSTYTLDLKSILKDCDISKVSFEDNRINYDKSTGILSFTDASILNKDIDYNYDTGSGNMKVRIHIYS